MYDETVAPHNYVRGTHGIQNHHQHNSNNPHSQHWYDEPPYESDPDDFLMANLSIEGVSSAVFSI